MTNYEKAVIRTVATGPEPVTWYKIEQRLSREDLEVREYLPDILAKLEGDGLIWRDERGRVSLTEAGRAVVTP